MHLKRSLLSLQTSAAAGASALLPVLLFLLVCVGCQTESANFKDVPAPSATKTGTAAATNGTPAPGLTTPGGGVEGVKSEAYLLKEGDSVRISFPGAPTMNTVATIRTDGNISLQLVGEVHAAGLTTAQLEKRLVELYTPHLQTPQVTVALESSPFSVYVTGAVLRPGRITSDRPMTALKAIVEAGGFDPAKANQKKVRVIRSENGKSENHVLNLKEVLSGRQADEFMLKNGDVISVPEKFQWF